MNQTERLELAERIRQLDALSDDDKAALLALLREQKKYGIVWEDKPEEAEERLAAELPVLTEVKERFIPGATDDAPNHILIEGDNLHALTALSYTHEGKIDVIYIDPPYNTGNKDFVYNDSYVDREDGYRHSKWLSFMNKRLKIAKRLLSDRGVIFISIDDNEQAQLKLLCDEVFGEQNCVCQMVWEQGRKSMAAQIAVNHEYCLIYCKSKSFCMDYDKVHPNINWSDKKRGLKEIYEEYNRLKILYGNNYSLIEKGIRDYYKSLEKDNPSKAHSHYKFVDERGLYFAGDISQGTGNGGRFDILHPVTNKPCKVPNGGWRFGINKLPIYIRENRIHFGEDENVVPCIKRYLEETEYEVAASVFYRDGRGASNRLKSMFGSEVFEHPKDEEIIARLLKFHTSYLDRINDSTILDFFAGSGTTLHATMLLNAEDGGRRQCILVTNNENGICENVTYERNKRVIQGYTTPKGVAVAGLTDNTLRYYRTDFVPNETTIRNKRRLMELSTDMLCIKNNLYCEQDEFAGRKLNKQKMRYFTAPLNPPEGGRRIDSPSMLVVYDEQVVDSLVDVLAGLDVEQKIMIYVFSNTSYPHTDNFEEVLSKVELCALPSAILNAYRKICRT